MNLESKSTMTHLEYRSAGGLHVQRSTTTVEAAASVEALIDALSERRGVLLSSNYDYPGRYTRWDMGFVDPPLVFTSEGRRFRVEALNQRGRVLLTPIAESLAGLPCLCALTRGYEQLSGEVATPTERVPEEERSKLPSVFSVLRALRELFFSVEDAWLGLYGAFGYDLAFQFEPIELRLERPATQRDLVLYLPDQLLIVDHRRQEALVHRYDFVDGTVSTAGLPREGQRKVYSPSAESPPRCDHAPGEYASAVERARDAFKRGDLFEVVLGQTFIEPYAATPGELFRTMRRTNPAPYAFLIHLGQDEHLVGASPEMYVRVEGQRVETCPISGTIARGKDAVEDAERIRELLESPKEESELTMCTDVDRNDKSRICEPGSVRVIGRRQIELYSRLIHTVDHIEGKLRPGFDALDAFLTHTWAVTVTGAPKTHAMQFIEDHERSPRAWYGGAIGCIGFNGAMNTGLTLRTVRLIDGHAELRAGATLLYDSEPEAEERETRLKASAFLEALRAGGAAPAATRSVPAQDLPGLGRRVLLVDHEDSFVHTLANYLRQTGAEVTTLRAGFPAEELRERHPDLVFLSPGPGTPTDFGVSNTVGLAVSLGLPVFGVCLGLQGIVEHFGGTLGVLETPVHGKPSEIRVRGSRLFEGLPTSFRAGRYHSLYAVRERLPEVLRVTAETDDGVIMAVEHASLPVAAVQFHPESILTLRDEVGLRLLRNVVRLLR